MSATDCPAHERGGCTPYSCPDYMARWLLGACSSGDPLRRAVRLVVAEFQRRTAEIEDLRGERDSLSDALQDTGAMAQHAEQDAYEHWLAAQEWGR